MTHISDILTELITEQQKLCQMDLRDPDLLTQSQTVDKLKLMVKYIKAEGG